MQHEAAESNMREAKTATAKLLWEKSNTGPTKLTLKKNKNPM